MYLLIMFTVLTIVNVILSTVKTIVTANGGKWSAAIVNAITYGLYTILIVYTATDGIDTLTKALITAAANLIGVFIVKTIEEKLNKEKLWKVECTINPNNFYKMKRDCIKNDFSFNYIDLGKYVIFNFYCPTQDESKRVKKLVNEYNAKYFVSESKVL